jgi:hypothetical protein
VAKQRLSRSSKPSPAAPQVFAPGGILLGVGDIDSHSGPYSRIERVRCLGCSASYVKPAGGGTVSANPGCPECGYVGWVLERLPVTEDAAPSRFFAGRPPRPTG